MPEGGFTASRTLEPVEREIRWNATPEQRFGLRPLGPVAGSGGSGPAGVHYETPEGWTELAPTSLRQANFLAGDPRAECYLTVLTGDGGGLAANLNRWRKQMSLEPLGDAEIAALPTVEFFGGPARLLDALGTFTGMGGSENAAGYRLVGLAQLTGGEARFLKLIGPADVVERELDGFRMLAESFHSGEDGHTHGAESQPPPASDGRFTWTAPQGWRAGPEKMMREVTFLMGDDDQAECYVSILGGDGGGLAANIERWCDQMGAPQLSSSEVEALPRIPMLGSDAVVVEIEGHYAGMTGEEVADAKLLGAVCMLDGASVFVKLIGKRDVVEAEREAFLDFSESLSFAR